MRLFWWRRAGTRAADEAARTWNAEWQQAVQTRDEAALQALEVQARQRSAAGDDVEIEEEMIEAARRAIALEHDIDSTGLPVLATTHRVVGADACHFSAPASLVDDPAQPSGRLLLTTTRGIFVGGPTLIQIPWHSVRDAKDHDRDIRVVRAGDMIQFRCNTYGDAIAGALIARRLVERARRV